MVADSLILGLLEFTIQDLKIDKACIKIILWNTLYSHSKYSDPNNCRISPHVQLKYN